MSYDNNMAVDVRGITTTGLTSSTTLANHLSGIAGALRANGSPGRDERVDEAMHFLNQLADACRRLQL